MQKLHVQICVGTHCTMMGAMDILDKAEELVHAFPEQPIEIEMVKCLQDCKNEKNTAPVVIINQHKYRRATAQQVMEKMMEVIQL